MAWTITKGGLNFRQEYIDLVPGKCAEVEFLFFPTPIEELSRVLNSSRVYGEFAAPLMTKRLIVNTFEFLYHLIYL